LGGSRIEEWSATMMPFTDLEPILKLACALIGSVYAVKIAIAAAALILGW
jgi:hypothetical protein